ncbi:hypothetical protein V5799_030597 [Amblyomma americanum]|uniref:Uncharacterized protein n=1 Tax=Amblyomma americanum TaxID=6943 RepID=A0AAQ4EMS0_AMBAM
MSSLTILIQNTRRNVESSRSSVVACPLSGVGVLSDRLVQCIFFFRVGAEWPCDRGTVHQAEAEIDCGALATLEHMLWSCERTEDSAIKDASTSQPGPG